ncbi:hypothetical protein Q2T41_14785 [Maribacter confluentis]|uniref:Uncharacterized protein n=1 Tax=Maribacter confluentis TaxID=1656093 RepID=A0ABT8RT82_9FLAO|nr:hypothetical protein [Maribacter confluentis]MDO1513925.1 hypothetical protein [Maribacter confluentis]
MKKGLNYSLGIIFVIMILGSCQPSVVFGDPQPATVDPLIKIPDIYRGIYWCNVDSATLYVDDKAFVRRKEFLIKTTLQEIEIDPDLDLVNEQLHVNDWEGYFPVTKKGDTITSQIILRDTIFAISDKQLVKTFRGHLVLNFKLNNDTWEVLVVSQRRDELLTISKAEIPEDLAKLDAITKVGLLNGPDRVRTQIYLKPTAKEFERIYNEGLLFSKSCTEYKRIFPLKEIID